MKKAKTISNSILVLKEIAQQIVNSETEINTVRVVDLGSPLENGWYQVSFWIKSEKITKLIKKLKGE